MKVSEINGFYVLEVASYPSKYYTWCNEFVGQMGEIDNGVMVPRTAMWSRDWLNSRLWFRKAGDAALFKLRWVGVPEGEM